MVFRGFLSNYYGKALEVSSSPRNRNELSFSSPILAFGVCLGFLMYCEKMESSFDRFESNDRSLSDRFLVNFFGFSYSK